VAISSTCVRASLTLFLLINQKAHAVSIQINTKDHPEHGLRLVAPTDKTFQGKLSAIRRANKAPLSEALIPYSVLLENEGNKAIVAYRLKWEMIKPDGTVSVRQAGGTNPGALMEEGPLPPDHPSLAGGFAVKPQV